MSRLYIDIGSTYFKIRDGEKITQYFRNFDKEIAKDLEEKCGEIISKYDKDKTYICSSANGGLSTLIIGLTNSFSLKFATNIAYNSGINIIDTILYPNIKTYPISSELIDVVIIVGGIDGVEEIFKEDLIRYLKKCHYTNIVYVGSNKAHSFLKKHLPDITILPNIINQKLQVEEEALKHYLTNLYQEDIIAKKDIKALYRLTDNQIYPTPYIVNQTLASLQQHFPSVVDPFIMIDIGGATTDIHYSTDLIEDNLVVSGGYDRLVFKKLGVYKSRESLVFTAKNNEFVYELLNYLNVTENILEEKSSLATKTLMQLAIFLVLYKVSTAHQSYITLKLDRLESLLFTGGITKVLTQEDIESIIHFFYKKILNLHHIPNLIIDHHYEIWTLRSHHVS
jgi:hypothetical protein